MEHEVVPVVVIMQEGGVGLMIVVVVVLGVVIVSMLCFVSSRSCSISRSSGRRGWYCNRYFIAALTVC